MLKHCCEDISKHIDNPEIPLNYNEKFREYGLKLLDGGSSNLIINHCPWCGNHFPRNLRDEWFDIVFDELELDGPEDQGLPEEMKSDAWWRSRKL